MNFKNFSRSQFSKLRNGINAVGEFRINRITGLEIVRGDQNLPHTHTHTQTHTQTHTHRHTDTHRHTQTHTRTDTDRHTDTHDTHRHTHTHKCLKLELRSCC